MNQRIKLNTALRGNIAGSIIRIKVVETQDGDYIPEDIYWRQRLKDSEIDGCIEYVYDDEVIKIVEVIDEASESIDDLSDSLVGEPFVDEPFEIDD